jgi:hypothetical protein
MPTVTASIPTPINHNFKQILKEEIESNHLYKFAQDFNLVYHDALITQYSSFQLFLTIETNFP